MQKHIRQNTLERLDLTESEHAVKISYSQNATLLPPSPGREAKPQRKPLPQNAQGFNFRKSNCLLSLPQQSLGSKVLQQVVCQTAFFAIAANRAASLHLLVFEKLRSRRSDIGPGSASASNSVSRPRCHREPCCCARLVVPRIRRAAYLWHGVRAEPENVLCCRRNVASFTPCWSYALHPIAVLDRG